MIGQSIPGFVYPMAMPIDSRVSPLKVAADQLQMFPGFVCRSRLQLICQCQSIPGFVAADNRFQDLQLTGQSIPGFFSPLKTFSQKRGIL
jgi:hypothetical protein